MKFFVSSFVMAVVLFAQGGFAQSSAPAYQVDSAWPKPLPDRWVLGGLGGLCVDKQDHVFILNRQDVLEGDLNAGKLAPPIIEFDSAGNVVNSWGDLKVMDPRLHSCHFDKANNMWIGSAPSGMVQKYSHDGKLLFQIGQRGVLDSSDGTAKGKPLNSDAAKFFSPSSIYVDPKNGDVYVSDGEGRGSNQRIAVMDSSGNFLRQWRPEGMETVHCMIMANNGEVYVCNRENARLQVYDKMGKFLRNVDVPWAPITPQPAGKTRDAGGGVAVALDFSKDAGQRLMFLINQNNAQIEVMDHETGKILSHFGRPGHYPGQFDQAHGIAVDTRGNVYTAENRGRRVQKFVAGK